MFGKKFDPEFVITTSLTSPFSLILAKPPAADPFPQLSEKVNSGGLVNPDPGPPIATPIIFPRAFTIALPVTPCPSPPIKLTVGGPQRRTFVLQSGRLGDAEIALSMLSNKGLISLFSDALPIILSKESSIPFCIPYL